MWSAIDRKPKGSLKPEVKRLWLFALKNLGGVCMAKFGGDTGIDADFTGEAQEAIREVFLLSWIGGVNEPPEQVTEAYTGFEDAVFSARFYCRERLEDDGECDKCSCDGLCHRITNHEQSGVDTLRVIIRVDSTDVCYIREVPIVR